jgi:predicted Zn-dependent protease
VLVLRQTSRGEVVLEFSAVVSDSVRIYPVSGDGWASEQGSWDSSGSVGFDGLAEAVAGVMGIPVDEAGRIAGEAVEEWNRRRPAPTERRRTQAAYWGSLAGVSIVAFGVLAGLAWLLTRII